MKKIFLNKDFVEQKILEMNLSKTQVSKRLGLSPCLFSLHLCGHVSLKPEKRIKMLSFFSAKFDELFMIKE